MNFSAASAFLVPAGTPSAQAHSQLPRLPRPLSGASAKPTLSATIGASFGSATSEPADGGVDPHAALAGLEQREVLGEAVAGGALRAGFLHHVEVEGAASFFHSGVSNCGFHFSSNQRAPNEFDMARQERHVLAPAGLAAQADAVHAGGAVGHLLGGVARRSPRSARRASSARPSRSGPCGT